MYITTYKCGLANKEQKLKNFKQLLIDSIEAANSNIVSIRENKKFILLDYNSEYDFIIELRSSKDTNGRSLSSISRELKKRGIIGNNCNLYLISNKIKNEDKRNRIENDKDLYVGLTELILGKYERSENKKIQELYKNKIKEIVEEFYENIQNEY